MRELLSIHLTFTAGNQQPLVSEGRVTHTNYSVTAKSVWQEGKVKPLLTHHSCSSMDTFRTTTRETLYIKSSVPCPYKCWIHHKVMFHRNRFPGEQLHENPLAQEWSAPFWAFPFIASQISATHWLRIMNFHQLQCSAKNTPKPIYL